MRPPGEHLEAFDLPVRESHDGLIMGSELTPLQRNLEVEPELSLSAELLVECRLVERVGAFGALDAVHRDVGIADEVLAGYEPRGTNSDADTHVAGDLATPERIRPVDRLQQPLGGRGRSLGARFAHEHGELVAAEASRQVLRANRSTEPAGEFGQQLVTGTVTPRVVDRLEAIEVEVEDRRQALVPLELPLDRLEEMETVRESGERVVIRLVAELLLQLSHLSKRMLQPAVLEQDARMAREGLEELDVCITERADVAHRRRDGRVRQVRGLHRFQSDAVGGSEEWKVLYGAGKHSGG